MPARKPCHAALTHALVTLFGVGSQVPVTSLWVELPVVVKSLPEGWNLPAYLSVLIALGNVGPLAVALVHKLAQGKLEERWVIRGIQGLGLIAAVFLALSWECTVLVAGQPRSLPYLLLALALLCCTSSVTFLASTYRLPRPFVRTFFIGQGLGALFPCVLALGQGVGQLECRNGTGHNALQPHYLEESFSATTYFWLLFAMLAVSALAFLGLRPAMPESPSKDSVATEESFPLQDGTPSPASTPAVPAPAAPAPSFRRWHSIYLLGLLVLCNALSDGVLPSVQSYSCLPYGSLAYHLAVVLSCVASSVAHFFTKLTPCRSVAVLSTISLLGCLLAAYPIVLAALSPCPPLVLSWILLLGLFSYVKVRISSLLHKADEQRDTPLPSYNLVILSSSLLSAFTMLLLISNLHLFRSRQDCMDNCK
ncbi:PREDICTED: solute carrier family 52, riboflavin transporter, member 2-like [Gavialis gangeticus]|uniref:solute carrier family 52, riboflavin transporter, member 2-like n=1 Tax=Gavialis gangeticus TaxID=94835 RepID=UPI00092EED6C|nr:PREDICTED: solute carrier family 52, riboflavin transporter, member 2-like [Gavialis gangeticus]